MFIEKADIFIFVDLLSTLKTDKRKKIFYSRNSFQSNIYLLIINKNLYNFNLFYKYI